MREGVARPLASRDAEAFPRAIVGDVEVAASASATDAAMRTAWRTLSAGVARCCLLLADDPKRPGRLRVLGPVTHQGPGPQRPPHPPHPGIPLSARPRPMGARPLHGGRPPARAEFVASDVVGAGLTTGPPSAPGILGHPPGTPPRDAPPSRPAATTATPNACRTDCWWPPTAPASPWSTRRRTDGIPSPCASGPTACRSQRRGDGPVASS